VVLNRTRIGPLRPLSAKTIRVLARRDFGGAIRTSAAQALRLRDESLATVRCSNHEFSSGLSHRNRTYLPHCKCAMGSETPSRTCPRTQLSGKHHRRASSTQSMISYCNPLWPRGLRGLPAISLFSFNLYTFFAKKHDATHHSSRTLANQQHGKTLSGPAKRWRIVSSFERSVSSCFRYGVEVFVVAWQPRECKS
jgi:hypothetical protein